MTTLHPTQAMQLAVASYGNGKPAEAEQLCRFVLRAEPSHGDALKLLGIVLATTRRGVEALEFLARAATAHPHDVAAHVNYAHVLSGLGKSEAALASYERALALRPDIAEIHYSRGNALKELERPAEALASYEHALSLRPQYAEALNNRGIVLQKLERFGEALASYDRALALQPGYADAWYNRGLALYALKRFEEALASYDRALETRPDDADTWYERGNALQRLLRFAESLTSYDRAIAIKPDHPAAWNNRAGALHTLQRYEEALGSYDRALQLQPDLSEAYSSRAWTLGELHRFDEALQCCDRALQLRPHFPGAWLNRGSLYYNRQQFDDAVHCYNQAIALDSEFAAAYQARGYAALLTGDLESGWVDHEWRWKNDLGFHSKPTLHLRQPRWLGKESVAGKRLFLHFEQGLGDTLQFCRYVPLVAELGAHVILGVQRPLRTLLASLEGVEQLVTPDEPLPDFDFHCALMSLPLAFKTTLDTIPARVPYLRSDEHKTRLWREKLGEKRQLRVGLVWSGGFKPNAPEFWAANSRRNIPLEKLAPLAHPDIEFFSLQKGQPAESELAQLQRRNWSGPQLRDFTTLLDDFSDTAALVDNLDLVIAVDTSTAHLAAALGKPVWLMNRFDTDWRWLLDRADSPWYPTLRQYRQEAPGDWDGVVQKIQADLFALAAVRKQ